MIELYGASPQFDCMASRLDQAIETQSVTPLGPVKFERDDDGVTSIRFDCVSCSEHVWANRSADEVVVIDEDQRVNPSFCAQALFLTAKKSETGVR